MTGGGRSHALWRGSCGTSPATGCAAPTSPSPVPLHALRRWRRGFNQAADLAAHLGVPVVHALRRKRHTGRQVELSRTARLSALGDAFALARRSGGRPTAAAIRDRSVVLVDDVITTGATVEACSAVLRDAGARGRAGAQRGSGSRGSIAAAISAATTSGACSASMRTQSGWAA